MHIDDFVPVVEWFFDAKPRYHTYNLSSGRRTDLLGIAKAIKEEAKVEVPIYVCLPGMGNEYSGDNSRILAECDCFHVSSMQESVDKLLEYYCSVLDEIDMLSLLYQ